MNDLGSIKVPSWFLDMDIPNGCLLLLILLIVLKVMKENNILSNL
ncbi:hypothetical protein [Streptococcus thermophilus]|nr:hypothetical protein [Streptococcus thermophilus]CAD0139965.1 protein of unknown function [Streptococcus thermophilus]